MTGLTPDGRAYAEAHVGAWRPGLDPEDVGGSPVCHAALYPDEWTPEYHEAAVVVCNRLGAGLPAGGTLRLRVSRNGGGR